MRWPRFVNVRGDLFATAACFAGLAVIKLTSSVILTRILQPDAYGVVTVLLSIVFVVDMLSDIGVTVFMVRDKSGETARYLNTAWTLRLARSILNSALVFLAAPLICALYATPDLLVPLRVFSLWFVIHGLESMAFPIAIRRKNSRIIMYSELVAALLSTVFVLVWCHYSRDYWGVIYGTLFNRLLMTGFSHLFYREFRLRLQVDREAAREMFAFTRFVMPSSILTLILSQFDKVIFLRLFDLHLLGIYGLAANIASPIESLIGKISQLVLYPRCAHNYRDHRDSFVLRYYLENVRLFLMILVVPAAVGGASRLVVTLLYDPRYAQAGAILQAFMARAVVTSFASPAEDLLIAAGESHVILVGNLFRAAWMVFASLGGYYFFGFMGFTYGTALSGLPPLTYYLWLQRRRQMLIVKYEWYKVGFAAGVVVLAYMVSGMLLQWWPVARIRF